MKTNTIKFSFDKKAILSLFTVIAISVGILKAQVTTYQFPDEVKKSDKYKVEVKQGNIEKTAFVHISECPEQVNPREKILSMLYDRTFSWTNMSFNKGPVVIKVTKLYGAKAHDVTISPKKYGIKPDKFDGQSVVFTLNKPEYVSIRFHLDDNTDEYNQIKHGLMIFADSQEESVPSLKSPDVIPYSSKADLANAKTIYFGPGVYNLVNDLPNGMLPLHDNQSVYIHGEAFIYGGIAAPSTYNVKISGRGILCGRKQRFHYPGLPQLLELEPWDYRTNIHRGGHSTVEGIMLLESFNHNMAVGLNSFVKDVKFVGWKVNNDGMRAGDGSVIDHTFMKVSDDHFYAFSSALMCNSIFWPMWNGAILQLGWGNYEGSGTRFVNNYIINPEWNQWWYNNGFIASQVRPNSKNSNILIQDLYVEGDINALVNLHYRSDITETGPWTGYIKDITFRNVEVDGHLIWNNKQASWYDTIPKNISFDLSKDDAMMSGKNLIRGYEDTLGNKALVENITFENLKIGKQKVTKNNYQDYFEIDESTTKNIDFLETENYDAYLSHEPGKTKSNSYTTETIGAGSLNQGFETPHHPFNSGWINKENNVSWVIDLPKDDKYDIKISVASGLKGGQFTIEYNDHKTTQLFNTEPITNNGYDLHKLVTDVPVQLHKGKNTIIFKGLSGSVKPDYIEITPSTGKIPRVDVKVTSVSVMLTEGDDWTASKLNIGIRPNKLSFNSRLGVVINPDERGPSEPLYVNQVSIFDFSGKEQIQVKSENLIRDIDISQLNFGPYSVLFTDNENFWIAKQIVK